MYSAMAIPTLGTLAQVSELINGKLMAQVFPFDGNFFCTKVHPNGVLLRAPFPSQLTFLQHLCIQLETIKDPLKLLSSVPKYWLEEDGTMSLHEDNRWRSVKTLKWLKSNGMTLSHLASKKKL